jgi:hypothetical protein
LGGGIPGPPTPGPPTPGGTLVSNPFPQNTLHVKQFVALSQVTHDEGHLTGSLFSKKYPSIAAEHFPSPVSVHTLQPVLQLDKQVLVAASGYYPEGHVVGAHKAD